MPDGNTSKSKIEFAPGLSFDELNSMYEEQNHGKRRSMPYEQYFGEMELSEEQKEQRRTFAQDVDDIILLYLIMMFYQRQAQAPDYASVIAGMERDLGQVIRDTGIENTATFSATHVADVAASIVNTTAENPDDPFMYSLDRAMLIAENEANAVYNDAEFQEALLEGMTQKTWIAIRDKRTRPTHAEVDGTTIPITEYFIVGDALLMYPKALCDNPEEVVNCRCSIAYS